MREVRDSSTSLEEIIQEFADLGGQIAEGIADIIRKYQENQISFAELSRQLKDIQDRFEGSDLDLVIDELLDRLQQEERDGLI